MLLRFAISPLIVTGIAIAALLAFYGSAPIENIAAAAIAIALVGYGCELLFLLPLYRLFKRNGLLQLWHFLAMGGVAGALFSVPMALVMFPARGMSLSEGFAALSIKLVPFGAIIGLALRWFASQRSGT
jgi:predicted signal transduction protein with EAL and GGDEF domain